MIIFVIKMKAHVFSSSLSGCPIPEDGELDYMAAAAGTSYSSLDGQEEDASDDGGVRYPSDLLGASWGSYLHPSAPPTRTGQAFKKVAVKTTSGHSQNKPVSASADSIKEGGAENGHPSLLLLQELQALTTVVSSCKAELTRCGIDTSPLKVVVEPLFDSLKEVLHQCAKQADATRQSGLELVSIDVLHQVAEYMSSVVSSLLAQGQKMHEQAVLLQRTGKQLAHTQQSFLLDQQELQQVMKNARVQLDRDKVTS